MAIASDGSVLSAGTVQADAPGGVTFSSMTASAAQTLSGYAGADGYLTKVRARNALPAARSQPLQRASPEACAAAHLQHDASGNLQWVALLGGSGADSVQDVTIAPDSTVVTGGGFTIFLNTDVVSFGLAGAASPQTTTGYGQGDGFVAKCTSAGVFTWVTTIGSGYEDVVNSVDTDSTGNVIAGGMFGGGAVGAGTAAASVDGTVSTSLTGLGGFDGFVVKMDPNGNLLWAVQIGGSGDDAVTSVAVDSAGNTYASGSCGSTTCAFAGASGFANSDPSGLTTDAFIVKISPTGVVLVRVPEMAIAARSRVLTCDIHFCLRSGAPSWRAI